MNKIIQTLRDETGSPYMTRVILGRLRLHVFHRGDSDEDCHDHPFNFWTFPLTSYVEEVVNLPWKDPVPRIVKAWRPHYRDAEYTHRVVGRWCGEPRRHPQQSAANLAVPGKIVTIVWATPKLREWGFLKRRDGRTCWVHWKEYVFGGGKQAPCA